MPRQNVRKVEVDLGDITDKNIGQLRLLHRILFPVAYTKKFYRDVVTDLDYLTKLAYYGDTLVGSMCCRVEREKGKRPQLYIMTLGVLAAYRRLGIGRKMAHHVVDEICAKDREISRVYLHIHEPNAQALEFYTKLGYTQGEKVDNYYPKLSPTTAFVLSLDTDEHFAALEAAKEGEEGEAAKAAEATA